MTFKAPTAKDLIQRNETQKHEHKPIATLQNHFSTGNEGPGVCIITCADLRCIPEQFLHLNTFEAVVLRTAGSNVEAALPSILAIDSVVPLKEIMVINHTDCGATFYRDENVKTLLKERAAGESEAISSMKFGEITGSLEDRAREHVNIARNSPFLRKELRENTSGYVFDLADGSLKQIA